MKYYLKQILEVASPTGYTHHVMKTLTDIVTGLGYEVRQTTKGAIVVKVEGLDHDNAVMFAAHADTLGAVVREIKANGRLKVINVGGLPFTAVEAENVIVHTFDDKEIIGTLMPIKSSAHLFPEEIRKGERNKDTMEVRLDEKVFTAEDVKNLGISIGNVVSFDTRTVFADSGYIKSRYLDDKSSCAILLGVLRDLKGQTPARDIYFMFSDYEEVGHGIYSLPKEVKELISVDIGVVGEGQAASEHEVTIFTKDASTPYHYGLTTELIALAKKENIPFNVDVIENYGSDASSAVRQGIDVRFGLIGPGVASTHHYERTHLDALEATKKLILAYLFQ